MANARFVRRPAVWLSIWLSLWTGSGHAAELSRLSYEGSPAPARAAPRASIPGVSQSALASLRLSDEQRAKVSEIQRDLQRTQSRLMASIREARWKQQDALRAPEIDAAAVLALYDEIAALRREYFRAAIDARKRIEGTLTSDQRAELSRWIEPVAPGGGVSRERAAPAERR